MNLLQDTISAIVPQDAAVRAKAHRRLEALTMPYWALGRLLDLAEDLAGITRSMRPPIARKAIFTMAGDHGVVAEGVSKYPQEVTPQMVAQFRCRRGGDQCAGPPGGRHGHRRGHGGRRRSQRACRRGEDPLPADRSRHAEHGPGTRR